MKLYRTAILAAALAIVSTPSFAWKVYVPHVPAPPPSAPSPSQSSPGGGGGGVPGGVVVGGVCFVSHLADFARVGIKYKRARTDKEVEFILATSCSMGLGLPIYHARWGDGKRKPRPMIDVIDPKHNDGAARYEPIKCKAKSKKKRKPLK